MANRQRNNWLPKVLGIGAAIAAGGWALNHYILPTPQSGVAETKVQVTPEPAVLPETRVKSGSSVTTANGFTVHIIEIAGGVARLKVTTKAGDIHHFDKAEAGRRLVVPAPDAIYYVDLLRIQENNVDLTVTNNR